MSKTPHVYFQIQINSTPINRQGSVSQKMYVIDMCQQHMTVSEI